MAEMVRHWTFDNTPEKWADIDKEINQIISEGWTVQTTNTNIVGESIDAQVVYEVRFEKVQAPRNED